MQTVIDLPDALSSKLAELAHRDGVSEGEIVAAAVQRYVKQSTPGEQDAAFGLWREGAVDGLAYQQALRAEWETDEGRH